MTAAPRRAGTDLLAALHALGVPRGGLVAVVPVGAGAGFAVGDSLGPAGAADGAATTLVAEGDAAAIAAQVLAVEAELAPRWVWWSAGSGAAALVAQGCRVGACWDLAAVHRLLHGGWHDDPPRVWAAAAGLDPDLAPRTGQLSLLGEPAAGLPVAGAEHGPDPGPDQPLGADGHVRAGWLPGSGPDQLARAAGWAALALRAAQVQVAAVQRLDVGSRGPVLMTARSESGAELLGVELGIDGLPFDVPAAEAVLAGPVGPRTADPVARAAAVAARDAEVLETVRGAEGTDLRSPAAVRELLARVGIEVPDTRSGRLEAYRGTHPLVDALLAWRKAERYATTYGYDWLDRQVRDGRLRGEWRGSDDAGGRMTASAGLHNLPAGLRSAVVADPGWALVRADLGQVEPRVLAAVSGDPALAAATAEDDLYSPVATTLRCDRPTAKVAFLAAMYGQTSGRAGEALRDLERVYPVAVSYLQAAHDDGVAGRARRTFGGRLVRLWPVEGEDRPDLPAVRSALAGRGRFLRNAMVQGAAAELFKMWALTVRAGLVAAAAPGAAQGRIVLCLHDELLVHVPEDQASGVAGLLASSLAAAAGRWAGGDVRFVADVSVVRRWSDAKA